MLDSHYLVANIAEVQQNLNKRGYTLDSQKILQLEKSRKEVQQREEELRAERNKKSKEIGKIIQEGGDANPIKESVANINDEIKQLESKLHDIQTALNDIYLDIPNLLHSSVPLGSSEDDNLEVKKHGTLPVFEGEAKSHVDLGEDLALIDFSLANKVAGSRFVAMSGEMALLHRALAQFMLNHHIQQNKYREIYMPFMANPDTLLGTGQLPKFETDLFYCERDNLYLIPTAEVVVTNVLRDTIVEKSDLPMHFVCHTPCFRREAGSYGRDTRGMLRQHQFEKVELVHFTLPEHSYDSLETMLSHAESVLQVLDLPYRVVSLCSQDIGFAAAKTYDIEVWLPNQDKYREISSCSNCEDFQARRLKARYRNEQGKTELLHTLNGSGVAVGRALIAIIENYQNADGSITVPEVLRPYLFGLQKITNR